MIMLAHFLVALCLLSSSAGDALAPPAQAQVMPPAENSVPPNGANPQDFQPQLRRGTPR
jgi:hypothetical protein